MGCGHTLHLLTTTISLLFLLLFAQGRMLATQSQVEEEKTILRGQIGSRPPRCERRCGSCGHCEAIQVPTTPQTKTAINGVKNPTLEYARGDYSSNYKPMSWKCKCGSFIFNP
ncbi:putative EPIDERMAL PATTERNING FACTOR-like protein [Helianthus annuus]|uniref:Epidermal patterning factor-like protein n=1 Tax=Helianthus annuus TaxID=4232 RepID=A0A251RUB4_HELAN|nr:EPIDERMAL PATTERNING FACTOR-like protein 2 [Helianthus annuus]KAF5791524.1 putative EPIDERMAL PATTERNING FACTOR-like protein [Helianthus annuus]KAJ0535074.1 putative EPIDERMAL PATTERNING FACTOR-like protein [Helianthus annuus]KAJ0753971.1 putative EPIDERMAL PATTERNING FACTOR-like protein [Helianthus annuus]KAJ0888945.1 putative EPIDERMAL PATTERNING FACTOR-like protein [Helianthus annuus]KAJ0893771.1 putative EPIDERMAL PATTERNING FACTOR-like protein [Helianthus annuus]